MLAFDGALGIVYRVVGLAGVEVELALYRQAYVLCFPIVQQPFKRPSHCGAVASHQGVKKILLHVTIEEETPVPYNIRGAIGIDTNPDGLGITIVDCLGQYRGSRWLGAGEWTYARSNRRNNLIGETVKKIAALAKELGNALVVEDLKFKNDKSVTAKFNRMSHGFIWSNFLEHIDRCAARKGVPVIKVKPAFTSVIGILKYQHMYGISNHESAGYVIARRGLDFSHEKTPKLLLDQLIQKKPEFKRINNWKQWSAVKKAALAKIKKLTERRVQSLVSWQVYRKKVLGIG